MEEGGKDGRRERRKEGKTEGGKDGRRERQSEGKMKGLKHDHHFCTGLIVYLCMHVCMLVTSCILAYKHMYTDLGLCV